MSSLTSYPVDLLSMHTSLKRECLPPFGHVTMLDIMPRMVTNGETMDDAVVQAARVSVRKEGKTTRDNRELIRYLMRHYHTSPFEMCEVKFHMAMPIFVARQFIRHRTANVNELSGRYSQLPDRFYIPTPNTIKSQSKSNKQGRGESLNPAATQRFITWLQDTAHDQMEKYTDFLNNDGVSRELARLGLPVNVYTEWYWKCDLHNIMHFLRLRLDTHAQWEIRQYAQAMYDLISPLAPYTMEAFNDYRLNACTLSGLEMNALAASIAKGDFVPLTAVHSDVSAGEAKEWEQKYERVK